jgi:hypothetical protein
MASWMKKTGHVVADEVEVALVGVELRREAAGVAHRVGRTARAEHRREPHEDRRLLPFGRNRARVSPSAVP